MHGIYISQADEEVFRMVKQNPARSADAAGEEDIPVEVLRKGYANRLLERRCEKLKQITRAGWRAALGLVFLGAIVRDLIAPGLGLIMAAGCFLWAWVKYQKEERYV